MEITLHIDGKEKTFSNTFIKARIFRNALKLNEKMQKEGNNISVETFDEMVGFIVTVFDQQFTIDDIWDGIHANKLQSEIMRVFRGVLNTGGLDVQVPDDAEGKK